MGRQTLDAQKLHEAEREAEDTDQNAPGQNGMPVGAPEKGNAGQIGDD